MLSTRYRPLLVWIGVGLAFAVQTLVAVLLGHAASFLPEDARAGRSRWLMFLVGAVILIREGRSHQQDAERGGVRRGRQGRAPAAGPCCASFLVLFAAEWGDLSQLLTISLVARYEAPGQRLRRRLGALLLVCGLAVLAGRVLLRYMTLHVLHYVGAARLPAAGRAHAGRAGALTGHASCPSMTADGRRCRTARPELGA